MSPIFSNDSSLRIQLREARPQLVDALERSWQIATNEWFSAVPHNEGSINSQPHIQNLEEHVGRIESAFRVHNGAGACMLSPIEVYVLLAGILFHDIGKCVPDAKLKEQGKDHGDESATIILNNHAELGIPDFRLAKIVARLARCHTMARQKDGKSASLLKDEFKTLTTRSIEPYGEIREHSCASLLILADEMDASFRRVTPHYTIPESAVGATASLRRRIDGVFIDLSGRLVRVVLGDAFDDLECGADLGCGAPVVDSIFDGHQSEQLPKMADQSLLSSLYRLLKQADIHLADVKAKGTLWKDALHGALDDWKHESQTDARLLEILSKAGTGTQVTTLNLLLNLRDLGKTLSKSTRILEAIHPVLAATGISLRGWAIEHRESLFAYHPYEVNGVEWKNVNGQTVSWWQETHEPAISNSYLGRITEKMWQLSSRILGEGSFTYDTLADAMREPEPERARRAVRRVACIARRRFEPQPLQFSRRDWRWLANDSTIEIQTGKELSKEEVYRLLRKQTANLSSPINRNPE
jgi:hypothetical protein